MHRRKKEDMKGAPKKRREEKMNQGMAHKLSLWKAEIIMKKSAMD